MKRVWGKPVSGMIKNNTANQTGLPEDFRIALLVLYIFILLAGTLNVVLMSCMLQSQRRLSFTKVSVINLIAVHFFFLLTVPFRIYYYASEDWILGIHFCKIVSFMIHAHMYLAFIFYVFLLIVRFLEHSDRQHKLQFHRLLHATITSATVWLVIFGSMLPATIKNYGMKQNDSTRCFHFGQAVTQPSVKTLNFFICIVVILVWSVLAIIQGYFLLRVFRKFGKATRQRQEFWAQLKNVVFLLVMFFCFVPYQGFRIYYVRDYGKTKEMDYINEIFLAVTAFSCFDMIVFAGRDVWKLINSRG
ncbi:probable G-protein coupled receptor 141 isoform X1 [Labeo rohita]|uniref:probable G-protein coupled receptor 141 isoform X1 n=1 Tax=Labeo rohita TaxID=84645 RepID=UPI0021E24E6F|nr:probable G-protein coupled receptor 141 isoform X1 [Labeo rohita]